MSNLRRLGLGDSFEPSFNPLALLLATLATAAWIALVRWRTARHQHALWKSLVLPAGGVSLSWLLIMTLLLPPLDFIRSNGPLVERLRAHLPADVNCVAAPDQSLATLAALQFQGRWRVEADKTLQQTACGYAIQSNAIEIASGWTLVAAVRRPSDKTNGFVVLKRF